ncbi:MAG: hypothetical protein Q9204_001653 [Flavoplaca sp. TL-2023a]
MSTQENPQPRLPLPESLRAKLPLLEQPIETLKKDRKSNLAKLSHLSNEINNIRNLYYELDELLRKRGSKLPKDLSKYEIVKVCIDGICKCHTKLMNYMDTLLLLRELVERKKAKLNSAT